MPLDLYTTRFRAMLAALFMFYVQEHRSSNPAILISSLRGASFFLVGLTPA